MKRTHRLKEAAERDDAQDSEKPHGVGDAVGIGVCVCRAVFGDASFRLAADAVPGTIPDVIDNIIVHLLRISMPDSEAIISSLIATVP